MLRINGFIVLPYKRGGQVLFCVHDPKIVEKNPKSSGILRSDFGNVDEAARWISANTMSAPSLKNEVTSSCPLIESFKRGRESHVA